MEGVVLNFGFCISIFFGLVYRFFWVQFQKYLFNIWYREYNSEEKIGTEFRFQSIDYLDNKEMLVFLRSF